MATQRGFAWRDAGAFFGSVMVAIKVRVDASATVRQLRGMRKQIAFATAMALTRTAQDLRDEIPAELDKALDKPTPFTKPKRPGQIIGEQPPADEV